MTEAPAPISNERIRAVATRARSAFWDADLAALSPWRAMPLLLLRIFYGVGRDITDRQLTLRAMSLVYTTLLAMVPLLAISFSVLKGLGVHNRMEPLLLSLLAPLGENAPEFAQTIIGFVDKMQLGVLGFLGIAMLFYTVISLIQKIEAAFNYVWRITRLRSLTQRFRDYLSVIIVGPVLVFASFGVMAGLLSTPLMETLVSIKAIGWLIALATWLAPTVMIILAFTFIYVFVPNTVVRLRSAFLGGVIAGILWNAVGWAFATFVTTLPSYVAVYSSFATPLLFLIWLYTGWLILLIGSSISFYHQNADMLPIDRAPTSVSARTAEKVALLAVSHIGRAYYEDGPALSPATLSDRIDVSEHVLETVLDYLETAQILAITAETPARLLPARPWESTRVHDLIMVMHTSGGDSNSDSVGSEIGSELETLFERLDRAGAESLGEMTLKDLSKLLSEGNRSGAPPT
jgi:membrane protein